MDRNHKILTTNTILNLVDLCNNTSLKTMYSSTKLEIFDLFLYSQIKEIPSIGNRFTDVLFSLFTDIYYNNVHIADMKGYDTVYLVDGYVYNIDLGNESLFVINLENRFLMYRSGNNTIYTLKEHLYEILEIYHVNHKPFILKSVLYEKLPNVSKYSQILVPITLNLEDEYLEIVKTFTKDINEILL